MPIPGGRQTQFPRRGISWGRCRGPCRSEVRGLAWPKAAGPRGLPVCVCGHGACPLPCFPMAAWRKDSQLESLQGLVSSPCEGELRKSPGPRNTQGGSCGHVLDRVSLRGPVPPDHGPQRVGPPRHHRPMCPWAEHTGTTADPAGQGHRQSASLDSSLGGPPAPASGRSPWGAYLGLREQSLHVM